MMKSVVAAVLLLVVDSAFAYGTVHPVPNVKTAGTVQPVPKLNSTSFA